MEKNIAKSPEMLAKEVKVKHLQKALKKRKTVLKSLKTRLKNTKNEIESTQRNVQSILFSKIEKVEALRVEIGELAIKMKANKHFSKADKKALDELSQEFLNGNVFGEEYEEIRASKDKVESGNFDFDDNFRAKINDAFQEFKVEPKEEEQRDIRKVFIKLSRKFHPDLAENEIQAVEYHGMMQQINEAYKNNDIHTLLELEQLYLMEQLDLATASITIDILQQEIDRLQRDIDFINSQVNRTSLEIKQLRKSDMGSMLTGLKKANREGEGIDAFEAQFQELIDHLEQLKVGFVDSIERGSISPILIQMLNPFGGEMFEDEDEGMNDVFGTLFEMMMAEEEDDYEENENPKFPIDSVVMVKNNLSHKLDRRTGMKGWVGRVEEALFDEEGRPIYRVSFDSKTMKQMSKVLIENAYREDFDFQMYDFSEIQLVATKARDTTDEAHNIYRTLRVEVEWVSMVDGKALEVAKSIVLADLEEDEETNWENYLKSCVPFKAKGKGHFELKRNKKVTVKAINYLDSEVGFVVMVQEEKGRKKSYPYPLHDLLPEDDKMKMIAELHDIWFSEIYEEDKEDSFFF